MTVVKNDYAGYLKKTLGGNRATILQGLVDQLDNVDKEIEELSNLLEEAKGKRTEIVQNKIPELMEGLEGEIRLPDGRVVKIGEKIRASLNSSNKEQALQWLEKEGYGVLIKNCFIIEFGKGENEAAAKLAEILERCEIPLSIKGGPSIHWQAVNTVVKDRLAEGEFVPQELFEVYVQKFTEIK